MAEDTATTTTSTTEDTSTTTTTTDGDNDSKERKGREQDSSTRHEARSPGKTGEEASPDEEHAKLMQDARRLGLRNAARDKVNNTDVADPEHLRQQAWNKMAEKSNREHDKTLAKDKETAEDNRSTNPDDYEGIASTEQNTSA